MASNGERALDNPEFVEAAMEGFKNMDLSTEETGEPRRGDPPSPPGASPRPAPPDRGPPPPPPPPPPGSHGAPAPPAQTPLPDPL